MQPDFSYRVMVLNRAMSSKSGCVPIPQRKLKEDVITMVSKELYYILKAIIALSNILYFSMVRLS